MKSVVVDIKDGFAAVLSDDGSILKIKNENYIIGQVIEMKMKKIHFTKKLALTVASAAVLLLSTSIGAWAYTSPYSYVSLDVNPSIEYTLNRFDRVIDVKAVNDDGQVILDQINIDGLTNQSIEDAILNTVDQISQDGYFGDTSAVSGSAIGVGDGTTTDTTAVTGSAISIDGGIVITISNGNAKISEELANELRTAVEAFVNDNVEVEVSSVGLERVKEAKELGVTPGKLNLVEKLKASSANPDSIVLEEWLNKPVKDIMKAIKLNKKATKEDLNTEDTAEVTTATSEESQAATEATEAANKESKDDKKAEKAKLKAEEKAKLETEKAKSENKAKNETKANANAKVKANKDTTVETQENAIEKEQSRQNKQ
jgi:hypothetical protein